METVKQLMKFCGAMCAAPLAVTWWSGHEVGLKFLMVQSLLWGIWNLKAVNDIAAYCSNIQEKVTYLEHRQDKDGGSIADFCRHLMAVMVEFNQDISAGNCRWLQRRLREMYGNFMKANAATLPVDEHAQVWSAMCSEVLWRKCRDLIIWRQDQLQGMWYAGQSVEELVKRADIVEKMKKQAGKLQNMELEVCFWSPARNLETMDAYPAGSWAMQCLKSQLMERVQEVEEYMLQTQGSYGDGGLQFLLKDMPSAVQELGCRTIAASSSNAVKKRE